MGLPFLVLLMLARRTVGMAAFVSLSASSASAMSREENGPARVAALCFLTLPRFACPVKGDEVLAGGTAEAAATGLMGVAGASCGSAVTERLEGGACGARLPILRMAGSTNGAGCVWATGCGAGW